MTIKWNDKKSAIKTGEPILGLFDFKDSPQREIHAVRWDGEHWELFHDGNCPHAWIDEKVLIGWEKVNYGY